MAGRSGLLFFNKIKVTDHMSNKDKKALSFLSHVYLFHIKHQNLFDKHLVKLLLFFTRLSNFICYDVLSIWKSFLNWTTWEVIKGLTKTGVWKTICLSSPFKKSKIYFQVSFQVSFLAFIHLMKFSPGFVFFDSYLEAAVMSWHQAYNPPVARCGMLIDQ